MTAAAPIASVAVLVGAIDPAWAPVANTGLIIILAILHAREAARVREAHARVTRAEAAARDAKRAVGATRRDNRIGLPDNGQRRRWTD